MFLDCPQIIWHSDESNKNVSIFSCDSHSTPLIHSRSSEYLLATAGIDGEVHLFGVTLPYESDMSKWHEKDGKASIPLQRFITALTGHDCVVNVVRFCSDGLRLASAGDRGTIIIWSVERFEDWDNEELKPSRMVLNSSSMEIYDLAWSPSGNHLLCAGMDHFMRVWDVRAQKCLVSVKDHQQNIQGVAWDPLEKFIVTQSSDRSCRIYSYSLHSPLKSCNPNNSVVPTMATRCEKVIKSLTPVTSPEIAATDEDAVNGVKRQDLIFREEQLPGLFFRRLTWTPDGAFLIVPAGQYSKSIDTDGNGAGASVRFCTYVFLRNNFSEPIMRLPGLQRASVAVRCCPVLFLPRNTDNRLTNLPYRVVFAVASADMVVVYDTDSTLPLAIASNLHFSPLTDVCWLPSASALLASSQDGYMSRISFAHGELGEPLPSDQVPEVVRKVHPLIYGCIPQVGYNEMITMPTSSHKRRLNKVVRPTIIQPSTVNEGAELEGPFQPSPPITARKNKRKITPTLVALSLNEDNKNQNFNPAGDSAQNKETDNLMEVESSQRNNDGTEVVVMSVHEDCKNSEIIHVDSESTMKRENPVVQIEMKSAIKEEKRVSEEPKKTKKRVTPTLITPSIN